MRFRKVWVRNGLVYRRRWRGSFIGSFIYPLLLLSAMGLGLGRLISQNRPGSFGAGGYLGFVASGLVAAVCMQSTVFEASFPMLDRIKDRRTFDAILATPMGIKDILFGEMAWLATRASTVAAVFIVVTYAFGIPRSPLAPLAVLAGVLTGSATSTAVIAFTGTVKNNQAFAGMFRYVITPMFLFSGAFFPVERLPTALKAVAAITPIYHGVRLSRVLILGGSIAPVIADVAFLLGFIVLATVVANATLTRRLVK